MSIVKWLVNKHEEDLAVQAMKRMRDGYPRPGDAARAAKHFGVDFTGDRMTEREERRKRK